MIRCLDTHITLFMTILDIHTHCALEPESLLSVDAAMPPAAMPAQPFSVGVHPWHADAPAEAFELVEKWGSNDLCLAIGECGIDRRRQPDIDIRLQKSLFERHVELSENLCKPLVIHCVAAADVLLDVRRRMHPRMPWAVHGFRGKPQLAAELLRHGMWLSLGARFNAATAAMIPAGRLLLETDDACPAVTIQEVVKSVAAARNVREAAVRSEAVEAAAVFLSLS